MLFAATYPDRVSLANTASRGYSRNVPCGMVARSPPPAERLGSLNPRVGGLVDDDGHESLCEPVSQGLGGKRWAAVRIWAFGFQ